MCTRPKLAHLGLREDRLMSGNAMRQARYIGDLLTFNFPDFEQVMYRRVDETDQPAGSGIRLRGILFVGSNQSLQQVPMTSR